MLSSVPETGTVCGTATYLTLSTVSFLLLVSKLPIRNVQNATSRNSDCRAVLIFNVIYPHGNFPGYTLPLLPDSRLLKTQTYRSGFRADATFCFHAVRNAALTKQANMF